LVFFIFILKYFENMKIRVEIIELILDKIKILFIIFYVNNVGFQKMKGLFGYYKPDKL